MIEKTPEAETAANDAPTPPPVETNATQPAGRKPVSPTKPYLERHLCPTNIDNDWVAVPQGQGRSLVDRNGGARNMTQVVGPVLPADLDRLLEWSSDEFARQEGRIVETVTEDGPTVVEWVTIDIDSHDAAVLNAFVRSPKIKVLFYHIEIQSHFPPPVRFASDGLMRTEEEEVGESENPDDDPSENENQELNQDAAAAEEEDHVRQKETYQGHKFSATAGLSLSWVLEELKHTHDFLFFPESEDIVLAHRDISRKYFTHPEFLRQMYGDTKLIASNPTEPLPPEVEIRDPKDPRKGMRVTEAGEIQALFPRERFFDALYPPFEEGAKDYHAEEREGVKLAGDEGLVDAWQKVFTEEETATAAQALKDEWPFWQDALSTSSAGLPIPTDLHLQTPSPANPAFVRFALRYRYRTAPRLRLPIDEFECYRTSDLFFQFPLQFTREWMFRYQAVDTFWPIAMNMTRISWEERNAEWQRQRQKREWRRKAKLSPGKRSKVPGVVIRADGMATIEPETEDEAEHRKRGAKEWTQMQRDESGPSPEANSKHDQILNAIDTIRDYERWLDGRGELERPVISLPTLHKAPFKLSI